jgi:D-sedoheptulose 7-phosphate isomerase
METIITQSLRDHIALHERLLADHAAELAAACRLVAEVLAEGGKLLIFGNGGSAADAQHMAAELVGRFGMERRPLPAIALTTDTSILTAVANDYGFEEVFARQVRALGIAGDLACGISTSGSSANVVKGLEAARAVGMKTLTLTGQAGGPVAKLADIAIRVPSRATPRIQEAHETICHIICQSVEAALFGAKGKAR